MELNPKMARKSASATHRLANEFAKNECNADYQKYVLVCIGIWPSYPAKNQPCTNMMIISSAKEGDIRVSFISIKFSVLVL